MGEKGKRERVRERFRRERDKVEREKVDRGLYVYQEAKEKKRDGQEKRDRERKIEVLRFIPREGKKRREREGAVRER